MKILHEKALVQMLFLVVVAHLLEKKDRWWDSTPATGGLTLAGCQVPLPSFFLTPSSQQNR